MGRGKSESIARWVIENSARRFPYVFPLDSCTTPTQSPPPGLLSRKVKPKGIRIVPTPHNRKRKRSPLRHEINPFELAWQYEQQQIQSDYFCIDEEDDFYGPEDDFDDMMDVDEPGELVVDEGYDGTMVVDGEYDYDYDNQKLISSIYDTLGTRTSVDGTPRTDSAFAHARAWADEEEDPKSTESVHCARCHTTYAPRDNGPSQCVIPHVFEFSSGALDGAWCASACCGPSIRVRRGQNGRPDEVRAESKLGEKGLDVCFRGRHTQSAKAVSLANGINRVKCSMGPYGCAARRLTYGMGRQLFVTDLCVRR
ncbi:hypothetical protein PENSPDRAFT_653498 [Peniophora sp. CONT]|nr:hypothetical protein PENSPDRAFT_653498 [Peniophora sp. CONT]